MQKLPVHISSFNFEDNSIKTHARNISMLSKWFTTDGCPVSINHCLEMVAKAHGFKSYAALSDAIKNKKILESLQTYSVYLERLTTQQVIPSKDFFEYPAFLQYVAQYILDVEMRLDELHGDSKLKGVTLYADGYYVRHIVLSSANKPSFIEAAVFNTMQVQTLSYALPTRFTLHEKLDSVLRSLNLVIPAAPDFWFDFSRLQVDTCDSNGEWLTYKVSHPFELTLLLLQNPAPKAKPLPHHQFKIKPSKSTKATHAFSLAELLKADTVQSDDNTSDLFPSLTSNFSLEYLNLSEQVCFDFDSSDLAEIVPINTTINNAPFPSINSEAQIAFSHQATVIQSEVTLKYRFIKEREIQGETYIFEGELSFIQPLRFTISDKNGKQHLESQLKLDLDAYVGCTYFFKIINKDNPSRLYTQSFRFFRERSVIPYLPQVLQQLDQHLNTNKYLVAVLNNAALNILRHDSDRLLDLRAKTKPLKIRATNF